ncbi:MAG: hypothetical protein R3D00_22115 [Bacteroidia bacterium]
MSHSNAFKTGTTSGILPDLRSFLILTVLLSALSLFESCTKPAQTRRASEVFLQTVESADDAGLDTLRNQMGDLVLLPEDLPAILQVLEKPKPDDKLGENSIRFLLFQRLAGIQNEETSRFIEQLFPSLEGNAALQAAALGVLAQGKSEEPLRIMMRILRQDTPGLGPYEGMVLGQLFEFPEKIPLISEELFLLAIDSPYELQALELIAAGLSAGQIKPADMQGSLTALVNKFQQTGLSAQTSRRTAEVSDETGQIKSSILQCFAYFPADTTIGQLLYQTMNDSKEKPSVRLAAAMAALNGGFVVESAIWEMLAGDFRTRNQLFIDLAQSGHGALFPATYFNQQALAEGDLAAWLASRGNTPEAFRLTGKVKIENGPEAGNIFVFEFKEKGQWMAGISGPQPLDSTDVVETGYLTTSKFEKTGKRKLTEIVEDLIE